jgi:hypothetical protein
MLRFQRGQPVVPSDVEFFLESERGRISVEFDDVHTTEFDRSFLDEAVDFAMSTAGQLLEQPTEDTAIGAVRGVLALQIAFTMNSAFENLFLFPDFTARSRPERAAMTSYIATCGSLGELVFHGLRVEKWHEYHPAVDLSLDNIVAFGTASLLGNTIGDGRKDAKRAARTLISTKRLAEVV